MDPGLASWTVPQVGEVVSRDWDAGSTGTGLSCAARKRLRGVADGEFEQGDRETGRSELVGSGPESKSSALPVSLSPCSILCREKEVAPNEESIADRERLLKLNYVPIARPEPATPRCSRTREATRVASLVQALIPTPRQALPVMKRPGWRCSAASARATRSRWPTSYCGRPVRWRITRRKMGAALTPTAARSCAITWDS